MRARIWVTALCAGFLLTAPAWAQRTLTFGGVDPTKIINQPVATPTSSQPIAQPQNVGSRSFSLTSIFPKFHIPSIHLTHGQSVFPTPNQMPGANYLKAFGYSRPAGIQP